MILFVFFLSLFVGINIRVSLIAGLIELVLLLAFILYRFGRKIVLISLGISLVGVGLSFIRPSFTKETYLSVVVESKNNYFIASSTFEKFYVYQKNNSFEIGDIISLKGQKQELNFDVLESGFDFKEYLNKKGIYSEFKPKKIEVKFSTPLKIHKIKKEFLDNFNDDSKALVGAILFSFSSDEEIYQEGKELHLFRLLSNSGIYLSILYFVFSFILSYLIKKDKAKRLILIVLFVPNLIFSFPRFIIIKFISLKIFRWINDYVLKKKFKYLEILSISGIFFLLMDYHLGYQDLFILSYFIPIESFLFMNSFRRFKGIKKKFLISALILISFIPFSLSYYHEIAPLSLVFQMVLSPFLVIYYFLSLISFLKIPIYTFINNYTGFLGSIFKAFNKINFALYGMDMSSNLIVLFEAIYLITIYYLSIRHIPLIKVSIGLFCLNLLVIFIPIKNYIFEQVSFINVGQGSSTLIRSGNTTILIDTGGLTYKDIGRENLIPYFKKNRIYDIDLLITTHDDFDHSGAVTSLKENFKVKRYVTDYNTFPIKIGNFEFKNYNIYPELWNEENDESLVIGFKTKKHHYLIMGDAPSKIEKRIIQDNQKIPCDILLVGHHGSKTSTSKEFVEYVKPKVGIISCGRNNKYGHPNKEVLDILKKYHVKIRRTDLEGTITYWQ